VTPENVVSKRTNACASLRKRLLRDEITSHSPKHGRNSRTCSRAIMPWLNALSETGLNVVRLKPRRPIRLRAA
jgi:hypothetical protein